RIWYSSGVPASSPGRRHPLRTRTSRGSSSISALTSSSAAWSPASCAARRRCISSTLASKCATACVRAHPVIIMRRSSFFGCFAAHRRPWRPPSPRHVEAAAVAGLSGGGSLLHDDPGAAGRVQVILDGGLAGEEEFHPIQGKPLCVIPRRPASAGQRGDIPINIALPNDDL